MFYKGDAERSDFVGHDYIHAKTWIVDDEIALVGSANCNRRGWTSDSEVGAVFFDNPRSTDGTTTAQRLRMKLWADHLNVKTEEQVKNALANAARWLNPPSGSRVKPYFPSKDDRAPLPLVPRTVMDLLIDDDFDGAPACSA